MTDPPRMPPLARAAARARLDALARVGPDAVNTALDFGRHAPADLAAALDEIERLERLLHAAGVDAGTGRRVSSGAP